LPAIDAYTTFERQRNAQLLDPGRMTVHPSVHPSVTFS
jgi:hypothetical protein